MAQGRLLEDVQAVDEIIAETPRDILVAVRMVLGFEAPTARGGVAGLGSGRYITVVTRLNDVIVTDQVSMSSATSHQSTRHSSGIAERRERQRSEARRSILDAAEALLIETGGPHFSMRSLGKRCGYSAPTVYHYFGDKDGLIGALLEERVAHLAERLERVPHSADPQDELRDLFVGFVDFGAANPSFSPLMRSASSKGEGYAPVAMERVRQRVAVPIHALVDSGRVGGLDVDSVGQMLWALLHGLMSLPMLEPDFPWAPDLPGRAFRTLLRGMAAPPTRLETP